MPLLKGINDDFHELKNLFSKLYSLKIIPYYLLHAMPDTLYPGLFRTSVKDGIHIMKQLKRNFSNPSIPEYIIVHNSGKHTIPLEINGTPEFIYEENQIKFKNWEGKWHIYKELY